MMTLEVSQDSNLFTQTALRAQPSSSMRSPLRACEIIFGRDKSLGMTGKDIAEALKNSGIDFDPLNWDLMTRIVMGYVNGGEVIFT